MADRYFRPIIDTDPPRASVRAGAMRIGGCGPWFSRVEQRQRGTDRRQILDLSVVPRPVLDDLTRPRPPVCGIPMPGPVIMGVLNTTPDSFSDGGDFGTLERAVQRALEMERQGARIIDIGGESTRPGADFVDAGSEADRTVPVIGALVRAGLQSPMSIDTRKADVAAAALAAGARFFNDVSAFGFDPDSLPLAVRQQPFVCLMHAQGAPKTMQDAPDYADVVLDVYDFLRARIRICQDAGLSRDRIVIDPGIGFGKTTEHNLDLIRDLSLFHGLGCPILLGASRKRFIGVIGAAQEPAQRAPGSMAVALEALRQGVQIIRVHDVWQTRQAFDLWQAIHSAESEETNGA